MKNVMLVLWQSIKLASPYLITVGIPSIINGMVKYPRTQNAFKVFLNMISALANDDSPHTFKLPLTMSKPPVDCAPLPLPPLSPSEPPTAAIILMAFAFTMSACTPHGKVVIGNLGKCELGQLPATMQAIVADATAILVSGQSWTSELESLAIQVGPGNLGCVVQAILSSLQTKKAANPGNTQYAQAVIHAKEYLAAHK